MNFFLNLLGTGGTITIIAFLLNSIDKSLTGQGLFEDVGKMAKDAGTGLGKAVSGLIPGSKVEPEVEDILSKAEGWEDKFTDAFLSSLEDKNK